MENEYDDATDDRGGLDRLSHHWRNTEGTCEMMRQIIRIGVLVVPWLMAVALPIFLFPGFGRD